MYFLSADYIFPVSSPPLMHWVLVIDKNGSILDILKEGSVPQEKIEVHKGILVPGFINAHCHLELSYLKNQIEAGGGLDNFIHQILSKRNLFSDDVISASIEMADKEMFQNGIVAVGDISNVSNSFEQKAKSKIVYHTFVELFDLNPANADSVFEKGKLLIEQLQSFYNTSATEHRYALTPHAPYSVSDKLFKLIDVFAYENNSILSIHNQETASENELFENHSGKLFDLFTKMGIDFSALPNNGLNSLRNTLVKMPRSANTLLVHNTFTTTEDIVWAQQYSKMLYWCFCPNANLYIEDCLPKFDRFIAANSKCCLGTDSYASNRSLSILDEMKTITAHALQIPFALLLQWATINGANFLNLNSKFGSFEKGKTPGINLIDNFDLKQMKLTKASTVQKIV